MNYDLEPAIAEAIRKQDALYTQPPETMSPTEVKTLFGTAPPADPALRPAGVIAVDESIALNGPDRRIPIRRYRPRKVGAARVAYFHGGGFTTGGLDSHDAICAALAHDTGAEVIAVEYRKLPDHPFPAAYDDAIAAASALAADGRPLALAGDSSGATLALAAALALRGGGVRLQSLLLYYPIIGLDFDTGSYRSNATAPALTTARCRRIWSDYLSGDLDGVRARLDWRAAPLLADNLSGLPPTVIVIAEYDPLRSDGEILAERLGKAGVDAALIRGSRLPHGFLKWRGISAEAETTIAAATRTFTETLDQGRLRASA